MSTELRSYIPVIPSLIASYAGTRGSSRMGKEINNAWSCVWLRATDERFVNWLVLEKVIDFCGIKAKTEGVTLFSRHITPLLLDAASQPIERRFLYNLATHLRAAGLFLSIIPKFGKTAAEDGGSFSSRAVQGVPVALVPNCPTEATATEESVRLFAESIDSFAVELLLDDPSLQLLESDRREWHLAVTAPRSSLLHELIHVLDMVTHNEPQGTASYRWTNPYEEATIKRENAFLMVRGEMTRMSHKQPTTLEAYMQQSASMRLFDAIFLAADGSARELAEGLDWNEVNLSHVAAGYLGLFMSIDSLSIDTPYREEMIAHKNFALENIVNILLEKHPQGRELASQLIASILEKAPKFGRDDAVAFVERLQLNSLGMEQGLGS